MLKTSTKPLAARIYILRNLGKTLPLIGVIALAVLLIAGIISLMNSIPLSIKTVYRYTENQLVINPRGNLEILSEMRETIKKESPVKIEKTITCRATSRYVNSLVGKWPFVVIGLQQNDMKYVLDKQETIQLQGRYPKKGIPEAIITSPVAQNLNLKIGSLLLKPSESEAFSMNPVQVVGIAKSPMWLMLTSFEYLKKHHFPPMEFLLVFAKNKLDQEKLGAWATKKLEGKKASVFTFQELEERSNAMFKTLYKILNVVVIVLMLVITIMMAMLMNIYLMQRIQEFGLLQSLGFTKKKLLTRVFKEMILVVSSGWLIGVIISYIFLRTVDRYLMQPQAYAIDALDKMAYLYTLIVPMIILIAATMIVYIRFRKFDPIEVIERRVV